MNCSFLSCRRFWNEANVPAYRMRSPSDRLTVSVGLRSFPFRGRSSKAYWKRATLSTRSLKTDWSSVTNEWATLSNCSAREIP